MNQTKESLYNEDSTNRVIPFRATITYNIMQNAYYLCMGDVFSCCDKFCVFLLFFVNVTYFGKTVNIRKLPFGPWNIRKLPFILVNGPFRLQRINHFLDR